MDSSWALVGHGGKKEKYVWLERQTEQRETVNTDKEKWADRERTKGDD